MSSARSPLPPPLICASGVSGDPDPASAAPAPAPAPSVSQAHGTSPDALEQLHKLGDLRAAGVLIDVEFEAKKAELLRRV